MVLTDTERTEYQRRGFFVRYGIFSAKECLVFREAAQRVEAQLLERITAAAAGSIMKEYRLDGNRFVDLNHVTVQLEHSAAQDCLRVVEPVNDVEPVFDQLLDDPRLVEPMKRLVPSQHLALWTAS